MPRTSTKSALKIAAGAIETGYRLDDQIGFQLRRAYQRAGANLASRVAAYDLTVPQFSVLARLHERGRVSQNLLGRLVVMEPANIRDVVLRLRKRGLIRTEKDTSDRRLILLSLTHAGSSLFGTLRLLEAESTAETLAPLGHAEQILLLSLLRRIGSG
jgi:MarR family transcriptional regulator, lower aerobic nicotinate degradation pathway regulator